MKKIIRFFQANKDGQLAPHTNSGELSRSVEVSPDPALDADLQSILDLEDPTSAAKQCRLVFASRGWPNAEHPGSVRDFLLEHGVPIR